MPIGSILKRASSYILGNDGILDGDRINYEDNETLFCKNNICVEWDNLHYPGYLTVTTKTFIDQYNNAKRPTLMLTWIPNSTLRKFPSTVEGAVANDSFHRQYSIELKEIATDASYFTYEKNTSGSVILNSTNPFLDSNSDLLAGDNSTTENLTTKRWENSENGCSNSGSACICRNVISNGCVKKDVYSISGLDIEVFHPDSNLVEEADEELKPLLCDDEPVTNQKSVTSVNITIANPCIQSRHISSWDSAAKSEKLRSLSVNSVNERCSNWTIPEFLPYKHNLSLPNSANASPINTRKSTVKCRRFSIDLSQMRSLRLYFNDENCTSGQLVIVSRESQYKILHFHHGGLDQLAQVLHQWHCLLHNIKLVPESSPAQPIEQI